MVVIYSVYHSILGARGVSVSERLFSSLGFRWDRSAVPGSVPTHAIERVCFRFHRMLPEFVWDASVLEGNPFTFPEVKTLLDGVTVGGHRLSDHEQILNLAESSKRLLALVRMGVFALDKATMCGLHAIVARNEALEWGHFRGEGEETNYTPDVGLGEHGRHTPLPTLPGAPELNRRFLAGTRALETFITNPLERGTACFLFGALQQFFFDGNKQFMPYITYHHREGVAHPRPLHLAWNDLTLPKDHPFWKTHATPNGWGCGCWLSGATKKDYERARAAGKTEPPAGWESNVGIDKGWVYNPGASRADELQRFAAEKAAKLPGQLADAFRRDVARLAAPDIRQVLAEAEATLANTVEEARVFAPDGRLLFVKQGDFASVVFAPSELSLLPGNVVTHSHPGIGSFSPDDIKLAAAYALAEIRAVDVRYIYSMAPEGFEWDWHWWARRGKSVVGRVEAEIGSALRRERDAGRLTQLAFEEEYWHRVWARFAAETSLNYRRMEKNDGAP